MKLADILATKQKTIRCPACQSKLDWQKKRLLVATGRCPCCATKIIDDLPPLPETPLVDPALLQANLASLGVHRRKIKWLQISLIFVFFPLALIGMTWLSEKTSEMIGVVTFLLLLIPFVWLGCRIDKKLNSKCPGCGKQLSNQQVLVTGRCGECGMGLLKVPAPTGLPAVSLTEYFRCQARCKTWSLSLGLLAVITIYCGPLLLVWLSGIGESLLWIWFSLASGFMLFAVDELPWTFGISCPDCGTQHPYPLSPMFLQRCDKCGRHLVDLDSEDLTALYHQYRQTVRRAAWQLVIGIAGALVLGLLLLRMIPFDCGPVNDVADLKPSPRLEVAAADNAWTYFAPAWQKVAKDGEWPWDFIDQVLAGKKWDEAKVGELLARHQSALESLDKGLTCQVCQPPPLANFLEKNACSEIPTHKIDDLLKLRLERERHQGRPDVAVAMALKMYRYGLLLQGHVENHRQYGSGHFASHQALLELRHLASEPAISEESLVSAERELHPGSTMAFWAVDLDHMLRKEYALTCDYLYGIPRDQRYLEYSRSFRNREDVFFSHFSFFYQPNRTQRDLVEYWRRMLAAPGKSTSPIYGKDLGKLVRGDRILSFNGFGKALVSLEVDSIAGGSYYHYGKRYMLVPKHEYMPAEVVLTRVLLICRLYEKKHGQLPETLQALVPEFVEAVPLDPYDGQPVRYSKERQIVYCVGSDGKDDGAPKYEKGWGPQGEYNRLRDQVLELTPKAKVDR